MGYDIEKHHEMFGAYLVKAKNKYEEQWRTKIHAVGSFNDYRIVRTLSTGSFGRVYLAATKKRFLALKLMEKREIVHTKEVEHVFSEIKMLGSCNFIFLVHLDCYFQNNCYIFIGMPFINGGELFYHLHKEKVFPEAMVMFYAAQIILAFEYLHFVGIVYRDLKPENILLDKDGYLKLTDFGFAKKINDSRTYTLCGTPEYIAPEVILNQSYNRSVDYWAMGILFYELGAGYTPFRDREVMRTYEKIIAGKFECPLHFSATFRHLLFKMIQVDRAKRFGMLQNGVRDIKNHDFFKDIRWNDILDKKIKPKYKPSVHKADDSTYFPPVQETVLKECKKNEYADTFLIVPDG